MRRVLALRWLFGALLLAAACGGGDRPPNLLVVTLDTTRADHLSCYGYPAPITPTLDGLAARGVRFERAYAPMPQTLPTHATLFTGAPPRGHGAVENDYALPDDASTLAERLLARGYRTAGFVGSLVLERRSGIAQGWQTFDQPDGPVTDAWHPPERTAADVNEAALTWALQTRDDERPFALWVHYYDPHGPFEPPESVSRRPSRAVVRERLAEHGELADGWGGLGAAALVEMWWRYAGEVAYVDAQLERLLAQLDDLGMLEDTWVVVVGDHGEGLMEHGEKGHGVHLFEELLRVPLIVAPPRGRAGTEGGARAIATPVALEHVLDAVLAALGAVPDGGPLAPALLEGREPAERPVFFERPYYSLERSIWRAIPESERGAMTGVVLGDLKAIRGVDGGLRVFDLAADADELTDVARTRADDAARLARAIEGFLDAHPWVERGAPDVDPERIRALEQLGYGR